MADLITTEGMQPVDLTIVPTLASMHRLGGATTESATLLESAELERAPRVTPPEHFHGREGFDRKFLSPFVVDIPRAVGDRTDDVLTFDGSAFELTYEHFSVVMSRSRRMAMFTAVNISGKDYVRITRDRDVWAYDGRIPVDLQAGEELYADNDLDRGHLVRREDPNWGESAARANDDTFHFTNCSPQMHRMNSIAWLGLETYILKNAKTWQDRVSVFTGPVFGEDDLTYRGVRVPLAYWKVVAFVSDARRPSATAYMVDQERELSTLEAAYGRYKTYQRSIRYIERISGLNFGRLSTYDGFSDEERRHGTAYPKGRVEQVLDSLDDVRV